MYFEIISCKLSHKERCNSIVLGVSSMMNLKRATVPIFVKSFTCFHLDSYLIIAYTGTFYYCICEMTAAPNSNTFKS